MAEGIFPELNCHPKSKLELKLVLIINNTNIVQIVKLDMEIGLFSQQK